MKNERVIKVGYLAQPRIRHQYSFVPFIKLAGKYLEQSQISIGDLVKITTSENKIIIERM